ncbi:MAG: hypothetical protein WAK91_06740 [Candidatus Acidiferrales bacterium]
MFPLMNSRLTGVRAIGRGAMACIITVGPCMMIFAMPAQANDNAVPAYQLPATSLINSGNSSGNSPNLTTEPPAPAPRWTLLPRDFSEAKTLEVPSVTAPAFSYAATAPSPKGLALSPEPSLAPNTNGQSEGGGHGHWLLPTITGGVLAGVGTYITVRAHNANCSNLSSEGQTICGGIKTGGIVLIPVGGALVALGMWMRFRH